MTLGRDFRSIVAARFGGRLSTATLTKFTPGDYDDVEPNAGTQPSSAGYTCDAQAFSYEAGQVDGERLLYADYQVMILRGTIKDENAQDAFDVVPAANDVISMPPPGESTAREGRIVRVESINEAYIVVRVRGAAAGT